MKKINTLYKKNPENLSLVINEVNSDNTWVLDGDGIATIKRDGTASAIINGEIYKRYDARLKTGKKLKQMNYYKDVLVVGLTVTKVSNKKFNNTDRYDRIMEFVEHPKTKQLGAKLENNGIVDVRGLKPTDSILLKPYYKEVPVDAIPCQAPDEISGHWPHWVKCDRSNPEDQFHFEAFDKLVKYYSNEEIFSNTDDINRLDGTYELCGEKIQGNAEHIKGHVLIKHGSEVLSITDFSFESLKSYLSDVDLDIEGIVFHHKTDDRMCKIRKKDFGIKR